MRENRNIVCGQFVRSPERNRYGTVIPGPEERNESQSIPEIRPYNGTCPLLPSVRHGRRLLQNRVRHQAPRRRRDHFGIHNRIPGPFEEIAAARKTVERINIYIRSA